MKMTKKLLAFVLSLVMVLSCFARIHVTANASADPETAVVIEVGENKQVTVDTPGEHYWVKFTPEEDGKYVFYSQGDGDTTACLYDKDGTYITDNDDGMSDHNFKISYSMTAGETYYLDSYFYYEDVTGDFTLHLEKASVATDIRFEQDVYAGYVGDGISFVISMQPVYAEEKYTYTVSQQGIISIDDDNDFATLLAPGTVTVTVTTESGCTGTCIVDVQEIKQVTVGDVETVEPTHDLARKYKFIPEETGTYALYSDDIRTGSGNVWGSDDTYADSSWEDETLIITAAMTAGQSYIYNMYNYGNQPYTIHLVKVGEATEISINRETIEGYPWDWYELDTQLQPRFSIKESIVWASDNEEVATVNEDGIVELKKAGTANITATTESGLKDTCIVTVKDVTETIALDQKKVAEIKERGSSANFVFTPEQDGFYAFYSDTKKDTRGYIYTADGEMIAGNDDYEDMNFRAEAELKAGETYYLKAEFYEPIIGSFDVYVTELKDATEMSFIYSTLTGYVGEAKLADVKFGPGVVKPEGWELSSADETIATIEEGKIVLKKAGTTKITATSESGLTCECTITAKEPEQLALDQELTVEVKADQDNIYFTYTPIENDMYAFYSTDNNGFYCDLYEESSQWLMGDGDSGNGDNFKIVYDLEAGKTYTYVYHIYNEDCDSVSVMLQRATQEVTGIELSRDSLVGYVDMQSEIQCDILPSNSLGEEVAWTSSNPDIVEIAFADSTRCHLYFHALGTATITATTESGLTDSCEVSVENIPEIKVNDTKTVNIEYREEAKAYAFTPKKDGTYVVSTNADSPVVVVVVDSNYDLIDEYYGDDDEPNANMELQLEEGNIYYIAVSYVGDETGTFTITLIDKDNPPTVLPNEPSDNTDQTTNNNNASDQNTIAPDTGDHSITWIWVMLMVVAVVAVLGTVVYRKKRSE